VVYSIGVLMGGRKGVGRSRILNLRDWDIIYNSIV
jgi:hypothetical protein